MWLWNCNHDRIFNAVLGASVAIRPPEKDGNGERDPAKYRLNASTGALGCDSCTLCVGSKADCQMRLDWLGQQLRAVDLTQPLDTLRAVHVPPGAISLDDADVVSDAAGGPDDLHEDDVLEITGPLPQF